jgi:hypothetical protein
MAFDNIQKEQFKAIFYTVSSVVLGIVTLLLLFNTYQYVQEQKEQIQQIQLQSEEDRQNILSLTKAIKSTKNSAEEFIPSNFESFFSPDTSNSQLTRMFDELETRYQASGQSFLINSISYGSLESSEESQTTSTRVNLALTTSQDNLLTFLRDIEKTSLSSEEAFYYIDPQSLSFSNLTANTIGEEITVDLQVNILLKKNYE